MIDILMAGGVIIGIAVVAYFFGHRTAGEVHKTKEAEQRLEDVKEAQEVRDEIETLDDAGLAARASQWVRRSDKGNN